MTDEEEFFAWLDGELEGEDEKRVAARVAADPALRQMADEHRAFGAELRGAFAPVMEAAPPHLDKAPPHAANDNRRWLRGGAMAASLALAVLLGMQVGQGSDDAIAVRDGGRLIAAASLSDALETQLASRPEGAVRIGLTFRDQSGRTCRSFTAPTTSGLACRHGGKWAIEGLFGSDQGAGGDYRMASGGDPRIAALVDEHIAGEAYDAAAEAAARDSGWK